MNLALTHARKGFGHTFPNPAVGCVLVRQDSNEVIGAGFHPRAGFPHAEVFALLEAAGHVSDGVQAAESVVKAYAKPYASTSTTKGDNNDNDLLQTVKDLTEQYASENGPQQLFPTETFQNVPVTAYVTLEPCCHYGKTPPCAASLVQSKVARVVVGFRDPNPRVDGGGVRLLRDANIQVDMLCSMLANENEQEKHNTHHVKVITETHRACADLVQNFVKRITPPCTTGAEEDPTTKSNDNFSHITGAVRRALRRQACRKKSDDTLSQVDWNGPKNVAVMAVDDTDGTTGSDLETLVQSLPLDPTWLERVDDLLWKHEMVLLRLNKAVKKKKAAKLLAQRIAEQLQAHVAQTLGHTALLYRPGIPPILDLASLSLVGDTDDGNDDDDGEAK